MVLVEADVGNADNQRCNRNECYHFSIFSSLMRQTIEKDGVRMKVSDASGLSVVRSCLHTPLATLLAAGALYGLAEIFYSNFVDQLLALLLFVATCLVIFHLYFGSIADGPTIGD